MRLILVLVIISLPDFCYGQIADVSFFPNSRSINPGIAHLRKSGVIALDTSLTNVNKHQDVTVFDNGVDSDITLKRASLYRGGKGKGITTEFLISNESGEKENTFQQSGTQNKFDSKSKSTYGDLKVSFGILGLSLGRGTFSQNVRIDSTNFSSAIDADFNFTSIKIGSSIGPKHIRVGLFYERILIDGIIDFTSDSNASRTTLDGTDHSYGFGLSYNNGKAHIEMSYEKLIFDDDTTNLAEGETLDPNAYRVTAVLEFKFKKISFGIKTSFIDGLFEDLNEVVSSQLLYGGMAKESRFEHSLNFSFGTDKGFKFSGFLSYTKFEVNEESDVIFNNQSYLSKVESKSAGLNISYHY